jgi:hypothetical protein
MASQEVVREDLVVNTPTDEVVMNEVLAKTVEKMLRGKNK